VASRRTARDENDSEIKGNCRYRVGLTVRKKPRNVQTHSYPVIQIRNVTEFGTLDLSGLAKMELEEVPSRFFMNKGDVLFCARGTRNQAAPCLVDVDKVVVGSQFFILKITADSVLPEYVAWFINQLPAQRHFEERTSGSHVRMILRGDLLDLPVTVPPLSVQRQILDLHKLQMQEQTLLNQLANKRQELLSGLCIEAAEKQHHKAKGAR
jgi:hypothetical protein